MSTIIALDLGRHKSVAGVSDRRAGADALYDPNIRTVYVPLFNNCAFQTNPYHGFESITTYRSP